MTVYENIRQCLTLHGAREKRGRGITEQDLGIVENAAVAVEDGIIKWVGPKYSLPAQFSDAKRVSAENRVWIPALVECHTHLVYGGSRHGDYALRCSGKTYQEIAKAGGGILSTVKATRETSPEELLARSRRELAAFESAGVACVEIKSGYGLTLESEIKMLECIRELQKTTKVRLVPTFLPAHAIPPEYSGKTEKYVDLICQEWIPEIGKRKLAEFFDAFVEDGYFNVAQTRRLAEAARRHGMKIKLHVDQFTDQGATQLAAEIGATSCDHLDSVSKAGIAAVAKSETVAVLAPGVSVFTGTPLPPARALIDAGACVALTTDFNPGTCPSHNLPLMMTLACSQMKMTLPEAIVGATLNAAQALNAHGSFGDIEPGSSFRITAFDVTTYQQIPYAFGEVIGRAA